MKLYYPMRYISQVLTMEINWPENISGLIRGFTLTEQTKRFRFRARETRNYSHKTSNREEFPLESHLSFFPSISFLSLSFP